MIKNYYIVWLLFFNCILITVNTDQDVFNPIHRSDTNVRKLLSAFNDDNFPSWSDTEKEQLAKINKKILDELSKPEDKDAFKLHDFPKTDFSEHEAEFNRGKNIVHIIMIVIGVIFVLIVIAIITTIVVLYKKRSTLVSFLRRGHLANVNRQPQNPPGWRNPNESNTVNIMPPNSNNQYSQYPQYSQVQQK